MTGSAITHGFPSYLKVHTQCSEESKKVAERENHRVTVELTSIADSCAALEWLKMLLEEAHQIIYRACHPAQIMNRLPFDPRQNKSQSGLKYVGQTT